MNCWNNYAIHAELFEDGEIFHKSEEKDPFWHLCTGHERRKGVWEEIVCGCLNRTFTIEYGDYELRAKCTGCGKKDVVYAG